jgi:hypothetical protein
VVPDHILHVGESGALKHCAVFVVLRTIFLQNGLHIESSNDGCGAFISLRQSPAELRGGEALRILLQACIETAERRQVLAKNNEVRAHQNHWLIQGRSIFGISQIGDIQHSNGRRRFFGKILKYLGKEVLQARLPHFGKDDEFRILFAGARGGRHNNFIPRYCESS